MTRIGVIRQKYGQEVRPQPFSLFTRDPKEQAANDQWRKEAEEWAKEKGL